MAGQGSAKVSLKEIDDSAFKPVNRVLTGTPAGVIGRAKRGPAFVPTVFADIQEFQDIFGSFADKGLDSNSNLYGPLAVSEWMSGNPGQGAFVRLLGVGTEPGFIVGSKKLGIDGVLIDNPFANYNHGNVDDEAFVTNFTGRTYILGHFASDKNNVSYLSETPGITDFNDTGIYPLVRGVLMTPNGVKASLQSIWTNNTTGPIKTRSAYQDDLANADADAVPGCGYSIGDIDVDTLEFTIFLSGFKGDLNQIRCSYNPKKSNYFFKVLNTDPHKIEESGHYLYTYYDIDTSILDIKITTDVNPDTLPIDPAGAFCIPANTKGSYEQFDDKFQTAISPWVVSQDFGLIADGSNNNGMGDGILKLFRFHALDDGEIANKQIKVLISNLTPGEFGDFGTFDVSLQKIDSNPLKSSIVAEWKRLSLDFKANNYIARVIGNKRLYWDFDATRPGLQEEGSYPVTNKFVRVEVSGEVATGDLDSSSLPAGFAGIKSLKFLNSNDAANFQEDTLFEDTNPFSKLILPPIPMIRSIGKLIQTQNDEKDAKILPWGVKFALKENVDKGDKGFKEYIEQTFNKSLISYAKYFKNNWSAVLIKDTLTEEIDYANDPNFFHLEKIAITHLNDSSKKIDNRRWGDAIFLRNYDLGSDTLPLNAAGKRRFFRLNKDLSLTNNKYLSFSFFMQGGFDGLDIFDEDKHYLRDAACYKEGQKTSKTGPVIETYQQGIDVYTDKAASEIQLLAIPGIREKIITNYGITAAEKRFDTMYIMDIEQKNMDGSFIINATDKPSVSQTIDEFSGRGLDTSFAACFFPDVMLNKPNGGSIKVPPSVAALGVMSRADFGGNTPWYAPAGINRGLVNANATEFAIGHEQLDELYDNDINPIYIPSGRDQVHIFGQKTLLKNPSSFDRINVRRLAIYVRRRIKELSNTFVFKLNRADTLADFSRRVEPILRNIQVQQGIERYKVQIDTTTTTDLDIEQNTIRGVVYIQPTRSIEFISLEFVVSNSID